MIKGSQDANDSEIWIYVLASAAATAMGGASAIMAYTSIFVLLNESVLAFSRVKDIHLIGKNPNLFALLSILAGMYGNNILSSFFVYLFGLERSDSTQICAHGHIHVHENVTPLDDPVSQLDSHDTQETENSAFSFDDSNGIPKDQCDIEIIADIKDGEDIIKKRKHSNSLDFSSSTLSKTCPPGDFIHSRSSRPSIKACVRIKKSSEPKGISHGHTLIPPDSSLSYLLTNEQKNSDDFPEHCEDETCAMILNTKPVEDCNSPDNCLETKNLEEIIICSDSDCLETDSKSPGDSSIGFSPLNDDLSKLDSCTPTCSNHNTLNNSKSVSLNVNSFEPVIDLKNLNGYGSLEEYKISSPSKVDIHSHEKGVHISKLHDKHGDQDIDGPKKRSKIGKSGAVKKGSKMDHLHIICSHEHVIPIPPNSKIDEQSHLLLTQTRHSLGHSHIHSDEYEHGHDHDHDHSHNLSSQSHNHNHNHGHGHEHHHHIHFHEEPVGGVISIDRQLISNGIKTAVAIAIHKFPEGLVLFLSGKSSLRLGAWVSISLFFHNFPEGLMLSLPIYLSTRSRIKTLSIALVLGVLPPVLGAGLGQIISQYLPRPDDPSVLSLFGTIAGEMHPDLGDGDFGDRWNLIFGTNFGFTAGMMLIVSLSGMLPTALFYNPKGDVVVSSFVVTLVLSAFGGMIFH
ncbi:Zinc transporter ZupT [Smittium mucronatum]|uniref:Zinc transporter ZupT n=1 Tax=Smittium mucronatum TaxID=133383 RepID=A0A1R0H5L2_9FUNG|nr:Zinc transporter ZupT [Smittium mucronatum]